MIVINYQKADDKMNTIYKMTKNMRNMQTRYVNLLNILTKLIH
jgi:hypothetical protein